jgi:hypothetical protein
LLLDASVVVTPRRELLLLHAKELESLRVEPGALAIKLKLPQLGP